MKRILLFTILLTCALTIKAQSDSLLVDSLMNYDLGEVTVVAQRQLIKNDIDKLTYDVQHDVESKSKNTLEMLRKVPLVTVDGRDNITVKGSSAFKIYRNGHRDPSFEGQNVADILKAIPANTIKKIEVITDPGAKEDAEGTNYILNIVMVDNARFGGVTGSVSANYNFLDNQTGTNAYVTTKLGKLVLSVNYGLMHNSDKSGTSYNSSDIIYGSNGQRLVSSNKQVVPLNVHFGNISGSYDIDSLNLLTLSGGGYYVRPTAIDVFAQTAMYDALGNPLYSYDTYAYAKKYNNLNVNGRMDFQHKTHLDGEVLTLSYMISATRSNQNIASLMDNLINPPMSYTGYDQLSQERFTEQTFQLDYVRPFGKYNKLEVGGKYIDRKNNSHTEMLYNNDTEDNTLTDFHHTTRVGAGYAEWLYNKGKWSARAGLRYEYSYLGAKFPNEADKNFHRSLNDWVPSASLKYNITDANSVKFSWATNISRPGISYLNPAVINTPTSVSYGNPDLNSSRYNGLTLEYSHIGSKITWQVSPFCWFSNNGIAAVQFEKDGKQVSTYGDVFHSRSMGFTGYMQVTPVAGTQIMLSASAARDIESNKSLDLSLAAWHGTLNCNLSQEMPWKLNLNVGAGCSLGHNLDGVYGFDGNWRYHYASLQRSFLKDDRLTVSVSAQNIFGPSFINWRSKTVQGSYTGCNTWVGRQKGVALRVSFRFGKLKASVKKVATSIENDDVVGGISQGVGGKKQ